MQIKKEPKAIDIIVDCNSAIPVYEQIKQAFKLAIISGTLAKGDRLTPIRELATQLHVNTNTIVKVYYQLELEGYLVAQPGSGYFVKSPPKEKKEEMSQLFQKITDDYLSKALKLGFSLEDMLSQLEKRVTSATTHPTTHSSS